MKRHNGFEKPRYGGVFCGCREHELFVDFYMNFAVV